MKKLYTLISIFSISVSASFAQALPNVGFEMWTHNSFPSYDNPDNWNSLNPTTSALGVTTCTKATAAADIHGGSNAVKLITKSVAGQIANGIVTTGTINTSSQTIGGGIAYTARPDSITGWYKYTSVSGDNGFVEFQLLGSGGDTDTVGYVRFKTPSVTVGTYTYFKKVITYRSTNAVAKSIWIVSSSADAVTHFVGSTMFIDDLQIITNPAATIVESSKLELAIGPNPVNDRLIIKNSQSSKNVISLFDLTGRKVLEQKLENATSIIDVNLFPMGLYIYSIIDESKKVIKTGKIVIQK
jgi:hypothetical protein